MKWRTHLWLISIISRVWNLNKHHEIGFAMLVSHHGEDSTTVVDRMMSQLPYIETCLNHVGGWFSKTLRDKKFDPRCRIMILEPPWFLLISYVLMEQQVLFFMVYQYFALLNFLFYEEQRSLSAKGEIKRKTEGFIETLIIGLSTLSLGPFLNESLWATNISSVRVPYYNKCLWMLWVEVRDEQ